MIFLRVLPKIFLWPHYSGSRSSGPRFIEPPEPPVPTPMGDAMAGVSEWREEVGNTGRRDSYGGGKIFILVFSAVVERGELGEAKCDLEKGQAGRL